MSKERTCEPDEGDRMNWAKGVMQKLCERQLEPHAQRLVVHRQMQAWDFAGPSRLVVHLGAYLGLLLPAPHLPNAGIDPDEVEMGIDLIEGVLEEPVALPTSWD